VKKFAILATVALLGALSAAPVRAGVVFDSLPPLSSTTAQDLLALEVYAAQSFSTGPGGQVLSGLKLVLGTLNVNSTGSFNVALYSDSGSNTPGSLLNSAVLADSIVTSTTPATYTIFSGYGPVLSPNSRYWIRLSNNSSSQVSWGYSNAVGSSIGASGEYYSYQIGSTVTNGTTAADGPYQMQVTTAVPEPGTMVLAGLVCGMGGVIYRRRAARPVVA